MHCDELPRRRAGRQHLLPVGRVVDLTRVARAADDAPAAEDTEEPREDAAVLVRRPCGINESGGGRWTTDKYMGPFSWGIGLCTCCCLCFMCCPCDERQVYHEPSGRKILQSGGPAGRFNEMCTATAVESSGWAWDKDTPAQEWAYLTWQD